MIQIPDCVRQLFYQDGIHKNCRIEFPNGERGDIINDQIVAESLRMTESLCSRGVLKFGVVEPSKLQVDVVGVENIKGYKIRVWLEIDCSSLTAEEIAEHAQTRDDLDHMVYPIPYGTYIVDSCDREAGTQRRRVVAYSKEIVEYGKIAISEYNKTLFSCRSVSATPKYKLDIRKFTASNLNIDIMQNPSEVTYRSTADFSVVYIFELGTHEVIAHEKVDYSRKAVFYPSPNNAVVKVCFSEVETPNWRELIREEFVTIAKNCVNSASVQYGEVSFCEGGTLYPLSELKNNDDKIEVAVNNELSKNQSFWEMFGRVGVSFKCNYPTYSSAGANIGYDEKGFLIFYANNDMLQDFSVVAPIERIGNITIRSDTKNKMYSERLDDYFVLDFDKTKVNGYYTADNLIEEINVRDLSMGIVELDGSFICVDRYSDSFVYKNISRGIGLYPSEKLYPSNNIFPTQSEQGFGRGMYMSAWYGDAQNMPFSKIKCTYRNENNEECTFEKIIVETDDRNKYFYREYDVSSNLLIRDGKFTEARIDSILTSMANNIKGVPAYMPCQAKAIGLPYLECGDGVDFVTEDGVISTFIMRRTISGIQHLVDIIESM